ncbi:hypothetical protein SZ00_03051 [Rhodococcus sp. AD45]|nr:hypothetical protein SZ00_03051 [Rhodococcus sp. AD45]
MRVDDSARVAAIDRKKCERRSSAESRVPDRNAVRIGAAIDLGSARKVWCGAHPYELPASNNIAHNFVNWVTNV